MTKVRKAEIKDLQELTKAFDAYRVWYRKDSDIDSATKFLAERIEQKESVIFIAEENETITGFTQLYPLFSSTRMKKLWLLNDLFVYKNHRGKGISKKLIDAAKQLCIETGACGVSLETEINNDIGNNLYPKTGFILNKSHNFYEWSNS